MVLFKGNWTRSMRWKVMVSSRRLWAWLSYIAMQRVARLVKVPEEPAYISWKRMLERSRALDASERSIAVSMEA